MATFTEFVYELSPPWLRRFFGERFVGSVIGLPADQIMDGSAQALQMPWTESGIQPPDALPMAGDDANIPRYPGDTDATYRARIQGKWVAWGQGGNEAAIIGQLKDFGIADPVIVPATNSRRAGWTFELPTVIQITDAIRFDSAGSSASGSPEIVLTTGTFEAAGAPDAPGKVWIDTPLNGRKYLRYQTRSGSSLILPTKQQDDDSFDFTDEGAITTTLDFTNWSRFALVLEEHPYVAWTYGDGSVYGSGDAAKTYGSNATVGDVKSIKGIVRKWKAGHEINPAIWLLFGSGPYYGDPAAAYGDGTVYGSTISTVKWEHQS